MLIVGAGCTGALIAALIPREAARRGRPRPRVSVWEWGRGPAGRMTSFWADVAGERVVADVGAQVISLRDPQRLPEWMEPHVMAADGLGLSATEEREPSWYHFCAPGGLPSLQRASLQEAQPDELCFNRRVVELTGSGGEWQAGFAGERGGRRPVGSQAFSVVVFAGTASDAGNLEGLRSVLSPHQLRALNGVRYDHRLCLALILKPQMAEHLEALCQGKAELLLEGALPVRLVARQEVKGRDGSKGGCAVVLHSTPTFAAENLQQAKRQNTGPAVLGRQALSKCLADLLNMALPKLEAAVLESKVVHWRQCQVRKPLVLDARSEACLVAEGAPTLILAGDYLAGDAAGSFEGCLDSADAAAAAALEALPFQAEARKPPGVSSGLSRPGPPRRWGYREEAKATSGRRWRAKTGDSTT